MNAMFIRQIMIALDGLTGFKAMSYLQIFSITAFMKLVWPDPVLPNTATIMGGS
jgi:hypothetical protein